MQGLRHTDENGGDGDQAAAKPRVSSEGNPYQKSKTQQILPTIFLKMWKIFPTLKNRGDTSPRPPLWRSSWVYAQMSINYAVLVATSGLSPD